MSLRKLFKTDPNIERKGIEVQYDDQIVTIARSGGANTDYKKDLTKELKPVRKAIDTDTITDDQLLPRLQAVFARKAVLNWQTIKADKTVVQGICLDGVEILPFTVENVLAVFAELPDLYRDLQQKSSASNLFLEDLETAAKN